MENPEIWLRTICKRNGLSADDRMLTLMSDYVRLLLEWNQKINLISRKDEANVWENHILHSISLLFKVRLAEGSKVLDLGTGGGLPGIPLSILCPSLSFTLLDATQKKVNAVEDMTNRLGISNVETHWGRAEDLAGNKLFQKKFDYVVARAVAHLQDLFRLATPLLVSGSGKKHSWNKSGSAAASPVAPPALVTLKGGLLDKELQEFQRESNGAFVTVTNLVFEGSEQVLASDKKIVVVSPKNGA